MPETFIISKNYKYSDMKSTSSKVPWDTSGQPLKNQMVGLTILIFDFCARFEKLLFRVEMKWWISSELNLTIFPWYEAGALFNCFWSFGSEWTDLLQSSKHS